jgi:UDP-N-acetyl-2-amino-2-deoxyglucuronate dehydrogenase
MIRVGIVGIGNISGAHIDGYKTFPEECQIVALCDIDENKAHTKADKEQLQVPIYGSFKEMITNEQLDLVSICTPPFTHAELSVLALEHGLHVLLEKPMASSLSECDQILEAQKKSGKLLSVIAQNRFKTTVWNMKQLSSQGAIGNILHTEVNSYWWRGYPYYDLWWRGLWEKEGGGCTLNHAVHHIDMMLWLTGKPNKVTAIMANVAHDNSEVEDISMALLQFPNNSLAQITSSVVHHGEQQEIVLQGTEAAISTPWSVHAYSTAPSGFPIENKEKIASIQRDYDTLGELTYQGHPGQIHDVILAIKKGKELLVTGEDGKNALELITAIYKSATEKTTVELPLQKSDKFYSTESMLKVVPRFYEKKNSVQEQDNSVFSMGNTK